MNSPAWDGRWAPAVQLYAAQRFTDRAGFPGNPNVRGAFHSHLECIRTAQALRKTRILLMEDDIALAPSIHQLTPSIVSQLETKPWDFAYFGHEHTGEIRRANSGTTSVKLVPTSTGITTAHFFAINGRIIPRLLKHLDRVWSGTEGDQEFGPMPVDGAYNVFRRRNSDVQILIADPKLGWQRPSRSDLSPKAIDNFYALRPLIAVLRDIKYALGRWRE